VVPSGVVPLSPHWGDDGTIVFASIQGLYRVPDTGGEPVLLYETNNLTDIIVTPSLLPGGRAVIGGKFGGGIMLLDLETDSVRELIPGGLDPRYVETGHILYADASGGLWAVPFDASRLELLGGAVPILDGLTVLEGTLARYSVSRNGTLVYGAGGVGGGGPGGQQRLLVVDLEGNEEPTLLDPRDFEAARWSPDGESVAYESREPGATAGPDIYTYNVELQTTPRRLTFEGINGTPVWSPDGTRIAFVSNRDGTDDLELFVTTLDDDSPPEVIVTLPGAQYPTQWPSDNLVVFRSIGGENFSALWMVDLSSDSAVARPYLESEATLADIMVSPDGNLAAYTSTESGTAGDVYVRSFPEARQPEIVSQGGGDTPFWSPDGNTIYYWTPGGRTDTKSLIAARIERGPPFVVTSRDTLMAGTWLVRDSDLHPDGDRWIMLQDVSAPGGGGADDEALEPERFLVVVNWFEELLERVGN
jgi:Tol biopolymer transport system component